MKTKSIRILGIIFILGAGACADLPSTDSPESGQISTLMDDGDRSAVFESNITPQVLLTHPTSGAILRNPVSLEAAVSNIPNAIADFYVRANWGNFGNFGNSSCAILGEGQWTPCGRDWTSPYSMLLTLRDGLYDFMVLAWNGGGDQALSPVVEHVIVDSTPPSAYIISPAEGVTVGGTIIIRAEDNLSGIDRVEFLRVVCQGSPVSCTEKLIAIDETGPYEASLNTRLLSNGAHELVMRAYDRAGNETGIASRVYVSNKSTKLIPTMQ